MHCFKYHDENGTHNIYIIDDIAAKWRKIGAILKFTGPELDNIETSNQGVQKCCERMLIQWLSGHVRGSTITWRALIEAIRDARLEKLANQLEQRLSCTTA